MQQCLGEPKPLDHALRKAAHFSPVRRTKSQPHELTRNCFGDFVCRHFRELAIEAQRPLRRFEAVGVKDL